MRNVLPLTDSSTNAGAAVDVTAVEKISFAAFESAGEGIVITDLAGKIQYANSVFEKISGYDRDEIIGQNPRILKSGKHPTSFYQRLWQTLGRGEVWRGSFVNRRKDGTTYHSDQTIAPMWKNYLYLGLYNLAYMFDDSVMLTIAVVTLSHRKMQEREGRWLKLISGTVMLGLGLTMVFRPDWLS